jgi:hypothetical protein
MFLNFFIMYEIIRIFQEWQYLVSKKIILNYIISKFINSFF